eukprot:gene6072-6311_t
MEQVCGASELLLVDILGNFSKKVSGKNYWPLKLGWALCGHEAPPAAVDEVSDAYGILGASAVPAPAAAGSSGGDGGGDGDGAGDGAGDGGGGDGGFHPAAVLPRSRRMALGIMCKELIDAARCAWIEEELLPAINNQQQLLSWQQIQPCQQHQQGVGGQLSGFGSGGNDLAVRR